MEIESIIENAFKSKIKEKQKIVNYVIYTKLYKIFDNDLSNLSVNIHDISVKIGKQFSEINDIKKWDKSLFKELDKFIEFNIKELIKSHAIENKSLPKIYIKPKEVIYVRARKKGHNEQTIHLIDCTSQEAIELIDEILASNGYFKGIKTGVTSVQARPYKDGKFGKFVTTYCNGATPKEVIDLIKSHLGT